MSMDKEKLEKTNNQLETENESKVSKEDKSDKGEENLKSKDETIEKLTPEEEIEKLKDKLARAFAEMENQRRRYEKEKDDAFEYGGFAFAREALNLLDILERSKISLENDDALKNTDTLKKVIEHFDIINEDMLSIFKKNNIEPIKSINEKLDPNLHQAMMEIEDDSKEQGTILQEIQKGFMMKDRLLRPSLVGVSKKKVEKESEDDKKDKENEEKKNKN